MNAQLQGAAGRVHAPHRGQRVIRAVGARHPDYVATSKDPFKPAIVKDRPNLEADVRYRRLDSSTELAAEARYAFAVGLDGGEARLHLARQALLIAAEDDAIASSSVVRFPVDAFMSRIERLAADTAAALATAAQAAGLPHSDQVSSSTSSSNEQWASIRSLPPSQVIAAVEYSLFRQQQETTSDVPSWLKDVRSAGFKVPAYGRSNLPKRSMLDHPGVWEDARMAYLNEVLVRRTGSPAACVILLNEVFRELLLMGAIDFAVTFDYGEFNSLPTATALPNLTREQLLWQPTAGSSSASQQATSSSGNAPDTSSSQPVELLNTGSSEALCELLRHLKRAYWPFPWDTNIDCFDRDGKGSMGGFRAAAKAALGSDEMTAALKAVSATAAHRLQRGIWTSPGAGDLNRCVAAAERLVMMVGDEQPQERRDLAVLLLHAGQPAAAAAELSAYLASIRTQRGRQDVQEDPFGVKLAHDLWKMLAESGVQPAREVMSVQAVLRSTLDQQPSDQQKGEQQNYKPLIW